MSLKQRVKATIDRNRVESQIIRHQEWADWVETPEALIAILHCPALATPPSQWQADEILAVIRSKHIPEIRSIPWMNRYVD